MGPPTPFLKKLPSKNLDSPLVRSLVRLNRPCLLLDEQSVARKIADILGGFGRQLGKFVATSREFPCDRWGAYWHPSATYWENRATDREHGATHREPGATHRERSADIKGAFLWAAKRRFGGRGASGVGERGVFCLLVSILYIGCYRSDATSWEGLLCGVVCTGATDWEGLARCVG